MNFKRRGAIRAVITAIISASMAITRFSIINGIDSTSVAIIATDVGDIITIAEIADTIAITAAGTIAIAVTGVGNGTCFAAIRIH
jgi:hypothetical protein